MFVIFILLLQLLSTKSYASEELDRFLEGANARDFEMLDQLYNATFEHRRSEMIPVPESSVLRNPHDEIPPFQAVLRAGAQVQRLSDNVSFSTDRSLYVKAKLHQEGSPYTYLLNNNDEPIYLTRTLNLSSLQEVTTLYPTTDPTQIFSNKTPNRAIDENLSIDTKLSVHFETLDAQYLTAFHPNIEETQSSSQRFQVESFLQGDAFIDFGLALSFQTASVGEVVDPNRISYSGIYFGPVIKKQFLKKEKTAVDLFLKAQKSLSLTSEDEFRQNSFSSNIYSIGADWTYQTFIGKFFIGASYHQQQLSLKSSTDPDLLIPASKESLSGLGVYAGYRFLVNL